MNGILCMNKPQDFTSFDVIGKLRGILHMKRLGHTGTLDPMATGVLPILVGTATKACDILPNQDKTYQATVVFGKATDTLDIWGNPLQDYPEQHFVPYCRNFSAILPSCRLCILRFPSPENGCMNSHERAKPSNVPPVLCTLMLLRWTLLTKRNRLQR